MSSAGNRVYRQHRSARVRKLIRLRSNCGNADVGERYFDTGLAHERAWGPWYLRTDNFDSDGEMGFRREPFTPAGRLTRRLWRTVGLSDACAARI